MTPTAVTPAARASRQSPPRPTSPHPTTPRGGHRTAVRQPVAPRRVSGPARPSGPARTARPPRPLRPARPARRTRSARDTPRLGLGARTAAYLRGLPDHSLLDRVVRGRAWIPLLGLLLTGIVAMQVEVLKLNSGIGHSTVSTAQLQSQNELMRANVARLADDQRIESMAAGMGMVMSQPSAVRFLPADGSAEAVRAAAAVHQPDAAGFAARRQTTTTSTNG